MHAIREWINLVHQGTLGEVKPLQQFGLWTSHVGYAGFGWPFQFGLGRPAGRAAARARHA